MIEYKFEWDPDKAGTNFQKHGVGFIQATSIFNDPLAVSILDDNHSEQEERWITLAQTDNGQLLVVVHTFQERNDNTIMVRIISARKASKSEQRQYERTQ